MSDKNRNYGIDLLRMISMFMIVVLHILGQGGVMVKIPGMESSFYASWFLETCAYCAVDCYGLISGYVGINGKHRPARLIELWFQVFFYSAVITFLYLFLFPGLRNWDAITRAVFPVSRKAYWYFSSYVGLFFVMPYLNHMVNSMGELAIKKMAVILFLVFSCGSTVPRAIGSDFLQLSGGYSFVWLCILYLLGASIFRRWKKKSYFLAYLGLAAVSWGFKIGIEKVTMHMFGQERYGKTLIEFTSPTILLCAVCLLLMCENLKFPQRWLRRLIAAASPLAFSVYLIHTQPIFWNQTFKGIFSKYSSLPWPLILIAVPVTALGIYLFCTLIDAVRKKIFDLIKVRSISERIAKLVGVVWEKIF